MGPNGVFGPQPDLERDILMRGKSIEVEDGLSCGEAEFFQSSSMVSGSSFLNRLQIFAQQVEARWNAEIDHDHVRGFREIVVNHHCLCGDVILWQFGAVVGNADGQRFACRLLVPWDEVTADDLVRKASGAFEVELDRGRIMRVDALEDELVQEVVVFRSEIEGLDRLAVQGDLQR